MSDDEQLRHVKNSEYDVCSRCGERWPCQVDEQDSEIERLTQENIALALALAQHREVIQKVYDYGSLSQAELDAKYPSPHVNGLRLLGAILAGPERQPRDQPAAGAELLAAADRLADALDQADQWLGVGPIIKSDRAEFDRDEREFKAALADYRHARAGLRAGEGPGREG